MSEQPLISVELSQQAKATLLSLSDEDRRMLQSLFQHLRNWHNDEFMRTHSKAVVGIEGAYVFRSSSDLMFAFRVLADGIEVISIFRKEVLNAFETGLLKAAV